MRRGVRNVASLVAGGACLTSPDSGVWPYRHVDIRGDVAVNGNAILRQDTVIVSLRFHNRGATEAEIVWGGGCPFGVLATGPGGIFWSNRPLGVAHCTDNERLVRFPPGQVGELPGLSVRWSTIRGSRPGGVYQWTVYYRDANGRRRDIPPGALLLP